MSSVSTEVVAITTLVMSATILALTLLWAGYLARTLLKHLRMLQDKLTMSELARTDASVRMSLCGKLASSLPPSGPHAVPDDVDDSYTPPAGEFNTRILGSVPFGAPAGESPG